MAGSLHACPTLLAVRAVGAVEVDVKEISGGMRDDSLVLAVRSLLSQRSVGLQRHLTRGLLPPPASIKIHRHDAARFEQHPRPGRSLLARAKRKLAVAVLNRKGSRQPEVEPEPNGVRATRPARRSTSPSRATRS